MVTTEMRGTLHKPPEALAVLAGVVPLVLCAYFQG